MHKCSAKESADCAVSLLQMVLARTWESLWSLSETGSATESRIRTTLSSSRSLGGRFQRNAERDMKGE